MQDSVQEVVHDIKRMCPSQKSSAHAVGNAGKMLGSGPLAKGFKNLARSMGISGAQYPILVSYMNYCQMKNAKEHAQGIANKLGITKADVINLKATYDEYLRNLYGGQAGQSEQQQQASQ